MKCIKIYISSLAIILLISCSEQKTYGKMKMAEVLADMRIVRTTIDKLPNSEKDSIGTFLMNKVYEIHNIDESEYREMITYLSDKPALYLEVEEEIMDIIIEKQKDPNNIKPDSK